MEPKKKKKKKNKPLFEVTPEEQSEFEVLDKVVRERANAFMECGKALIKIQENKLWRAGNWPTWEDYCCQVAGFSKSYASRIMKTSRLASDLCKKLPIGNSLKPISESQVRPLLQLPELDQQEQAWVAAVKKADGKQPTAAVVQEMVFELLHPNGPTETSQSRSQRRSEVVSRLREVVAQRKSWEQVERLMEELEELL